MIKYKRIFLALILSVGFFIFLVLLNQNEKSHKKQDYLRNLKINLNFDFEIQHENENIDFVLEHSRESEFEKPIVSLKLSKKNPNLSDKKIMISWETTPTYLTQNSWIGIYPYGQKTASWNLQSYFILNNTLKGVQEIDIPKESGIYEARYIQDNNLYSIATSGSFVVNPLDSYLLTNKHEFQLNEYALIKWKIGSDALIKFKEGKNNMKPLETRICLNILGENSYDDCLWSQIIDSEEGITEIDIPDLAGYYLVRIMIKYHTWKNDPETECLVTSNIIKVSDSDFKIVSKQNRTTVASNISVDWKLKKFNQQDWIGLFAISETSIFLRSANPIASTKVKTKEGDFSFYLPPNNPAGAYILIYFSSHKPVAVSQIIKLEQPSLVCPKKKTVSNIKHLVIICTENHSFDSYFGSYCEADNMSNPKCNQGRKCCEKPPSILQGHNPVVLNDEQNIKYDPDHSQDCERCQINGGKMDGYVEGCACSNPQNFAVADPITVKILHDLADKYSLSDNYFQPTAGASSQNDMFFARASYVFKDNMKIPIGSIGSNCWYLSHGIPSEIEMFYDPSITSILSKCGVVLKSYAEGYRNASMSFENNRCYPQGYDSGDIPFGYYAGVSDRKEYMADYEDFKSDLFNRTLPEISFIKPLGINTGHPSAGNITSELNFIKKTVDYILNSTYTNETLIIWVPDESGGFYDHVSPPQTNVVDGIPYGPRIPMLAMGKFAKKNYISHVEMEHSSIVKFIEWNWLGGISGQLNTRDRNVNNLGDIINEHEAGVEVPI